LSGAKLIQLQALDGSAYCMDQREVTMGEYAAFVQAKGGDTSGQPANCAWNKTWEPDLIPPDAWENPEGSCDPKGYDPSTYPNKAVGCVDWCDANAYCSWAGKRLCERVGGGLGSLEDAESPATSEWANACTQGGTTKYPWGDSYTNGRCIDYTAIQDEGDAARDVVANLPSSQCHGAEDGFDEVFDLVGSVQEWTAECDQEGTSCAAHGISQFFPNGEPPSCAAGVSPAASAYPSVGFRCCADVGP
jgi:formylglycine-generating enzyme required for sulfatase activity